MATFGERLGAAWLIMSAQDDPPPNNVSTLSRGRKGKGQPLDEELVSGFLEAAEDRDPPIIMEMEALLRQLHMKWPIRARRVQRDINWLRGEAHKVGFAWGKKRWWHR